MLKQVAKTVLPAPAYRRLRAWHQRPPAVRWGSLRRLTPVSRTFGFDRGLPIDRCYMERFLVSHRRDIRGRVLEIAEPVYTRKFGDERVTQADVLHTSAGDPQATLIGDLVSGDGIPTEAFDCIILTQTLGFIYEVRQALHHLAAALKPGGVLLATCAGISQISRFDMDRWGDYWRFTSLSLGRFFAEAFAPGHVEVKAYGNVLTATAFLQGLASNELKPEEFDAQDRDYELLLGVRAVRTPREGP